MSDIESRSKSATARYNVIVADKMKIDAEHEARKRALRSVIEECRKAGFNPDTIADEIKKMKEVISVKLYLFEADLASAEDQIRPMMKDIE